MEPGMARIVFGLLILSAVSASPLSAQGGTRPVRSRECRRSHPCHCLRRLPSAHGSGRPGRGYWQQRADYRIAATLDTATRQIRGRETIHYANNSPDALRYLWMFVEQNICAAPASPTSSTSRRWSSWAPPSTSPARASMGG